MPRARARGRPGHPARVSALAAPAAPATFAIAVLTIAIGATTGVFSVLNAVLLQSLPFSEPDRLASLRNFETAADGFHDWRRQNVYLEDATTYDSLDQSRRRAPGRRRRLTETSWNFFSVLGRGPALGRGFAPGEDRQAGPASPSSVIRRGSSCLVATRERSDPRSASTAHCSPSSALRRRASTIRTRRTSGRRPHSTTSALPKRLGLHVDDDRTFEGWHDLGAGGAGLRSRSGSARPSAHDHGCGERAALIPLQAQLAGPVRTASLILMGGVALLLLLACANIANLLLGRTVARSSELMIRTALGASRARLTQQLLTEALVLSLVATVAGLLVARWTSALATAVQPAQLSSQSYTILDWRVLFFSIALATALVFGVGPAVYASRVGVIGAARSSTPGVRHTRTRALLIATQIAVTITLLTGSIALGRAFLALSIDNGFQMKSIASLSVSLAGTGHGATRRASYLRDVFRRVQQVPGVTAASGTEALPLNIDASMGGHFNVDGRAPLQPDDRRPGRARVLRGHGYAGDRGTGVHVPGSGADRTDCRGERTVSRGTANLRLVGRIDGRRVARAAHCRGRAWHAKSGPAYETTPADL